MKDYIQKLLSISSPPILTSPLASEFSLLSHLKQHGKELFKLLSKKNGFYAFESALHVFPLGKKEGAMHLEMWNSESLWRGDYQGLADGCFFFAEDIFGVQFCFKDDRLCTFDPETGETKEFAHDLQGWTHIILGDYELHTGFPFARDWQQKNGPLPEGRRLVPKIPFVCKGEFALDNFYDLDSV